MNIYEMYTENGDIADFWIKHKTWGIGTAARVLSIDGLYFGKLKGKAPYFVGNPPVLCELYVQGKLESSSMLLPDAETDSYYRINDLDGLAIIITNNGVLG